jgi:hypothetical protein
VNRREFLSGIFAACATTTVPQEIAPPESVEDIVWELGPTQTPFTTILREGLSTYHEWTVDCL